IDIDCLSKKLIVFAKIDWDSYETSWDFTTLPLLEEDSGKWKVESKGERVDSGQWIVDSEEEKLPTNHYPLTTYPIPKTIAETYKTLRQQWAEMTLEMQRLEEENNRIFIEAYGLQEELTPEVPLKEITLTCNPYYRYGKEEVDSNRQVDSGQWTVDSETEKLPTNHYPLTTNFPYDEALEKRLLEDTMKEFISYAVGCMFGRYSLDKQGLILANQGETIEDYYRIIGDDKGLGIRDEGLVENETLTTSHFPLPTSHFSPTKTNVIPILDGDWFSDDITAQFRQFLRITFGEANYQTNLKFIEDAIGKKIGKYFQSDFYNDHVKRYKKRPIYWLFSSPKGSFNALIYLHRYRPDTVSIVLNEYLREYRRKLEGQLEHFKQIEVSADVSTSQKTKALKETAKLTKIVNELNEFDRTILYPLAIEKLEIDLDDGVKVNYPKFGKALKEIK
ncbi:hypothetical protein ACN4EE_23420, partial [Geminocystis sp. CENA526]|uniref:hypothetical protein n=1 Tax=Geminocystis sp. CENA526 TaxID=1355871 RepID=UPI003D6E09C5